LKYEPPCGCPVATLEKTVAWLVYSSVVLGLLFLYVLYGTPGIPAFLFPSILGGEVVWLVCAVAISRRVRSAPYLAVVLALITLTISVSQPTHYTFAETGQIVAFLIFAGGSVLQVALIAAVSLLVYRSRRK
jgi:hypothetical protein